MQEYKAYNVNLILNKLQAVLNVKNDREIARLFNVAPNTISAWRVRNTINIEKILEICAVNNLDLNYILRGDATTISEVREPAALYISKPKGIPLLPITAMASLSENSLSVNNYEIDTYINVPVFNPKPEFIIRISGNSMIPTYYNDDLIACRSITIDEFIFDKPYLITVNHAPMVKRLLPGINGIICRSDNPSIKDFEITLEQINSIYHICGLIRDKLA